ncbi:MAG: hypothetical protein Kow0090_06630 [Myxococcota bacterium]
MNRAFQLKYTLIITVVGAIIALLLGIFLYRAIQESTQVLATSLQEYPELMERVNSEDQQILFVLIFGIAALVIALLVWGVLMTHRVAGPLFIITRYTNQIADGIYPNLRPLRKQDELQDFFEAYKDMVNELIKRDENDYNALTEMAKKHEEMIKMLTHQGGACAEIAKEMTAELSKIEEIANRKAKRLNRG